MRYSLKRKFINYRGIELYKTASISSVAPEELNPGSLVFHKEISDVSIIFPVNQKKYYSQDYLRIYKPGTKIDKDFDLKVYIKGGFIIPTSLPIYATLQGILPKYHSKTSDWDYQFYRDDNNNAIPILSTPKSKKGWEDVCKVFLEFAVFQSLFGNCIFRIYFVDYKGNEKEKTFSWIPSAISLGYRAIIYPQLKKKVSSKMGETIKLSSGVKNKILKYAESKYSGDCYFVNLGHSSFFMNPNYMTNEEVGELKKQGYKSERLRCEGDWLLKAYEDKKRIIMYSDLDSPVAIAHEIGHLEIDLEGGIKKDIQRYDDSGIFERDNGFMKFLFFCLGAFGDPGEITGTILPIILRTPTIYTEYMASYRGLKILEKAGVGKEDLEKAKLYYKRALNTYLVGATKNIGLASLGKMGRSIFKMK